MTNAFTPNISITKQDVEQERNFCFGELNNQKHNSLVGIKKCSLKQVTSRSCNSNIMIDKICSVGVHRS